MAKVIFKSEDVKFKRPSPALVWIFYVLDRIARQVPGLPSAIVITSINDGVHMTNSRHYSDEAVDIRSKNFRTPGLKERFRKILEAQLNNHVVMPGHFVVLFEGANTENQHFHVQVRRGMKFLEEA